MEAKSLDPSKTQLQKIFDLVSRGQFEEVLNQTASALESFPGSWRLYNVQGFARTELGELDEALASYRSALEIGPEQSSIHINMAVTLGKKGLLNEALDSYQKALEITPDNPEAYFNQGTTLAQSGQLDLAVENFNRVLQINPEHEKAWFNLGNILLQRREFEKARKCYETILGIAGDSVEVHLNLGITYRALGEHEQSLSSYQKVIQLNPKHAGAFNSVGVIQQESGDFQSAIENYKKALECSPKYPEALQNMGTALREIGELDLALGKYQEALLINPNVAQTHYNNGIALFDKGEILSAIKSYDNAIKLDINNARIYYSRGVACKLMENPNAAINDFRQALKLKPDYVDALYNLGLCFQDHALLNEARDCYQRLLSLENDHATALNALGSVQLLTLDLQVSAKNLKRAIELKPDFAEAYSNLGTIFQMQGKPETAFNYFKKGYGFNGLSQREDADQKLVALRHFGRSGSMFFHSLFDGHPEVATIPGVYFKGWFNKNAWERIAPNFSNERWRDLLIDKLMNIYEPLFDSNSKKNVPGKPFAGTEWLAKESGFLKMGANRDQNFCLDQCRFKENFLKLLNEFQFVDEISCFNLFHEAFDKSFRNSMQHNRENKKIIFYHIHNPSVVEMMNLVQSYKNCLSLYIVRHPIQNLESWMLSDWTTKEFSLPIWQNMVDKFGKLIFDLSSPLNENAKAVRLEDIKSDPKFAIREVANWLGIANDPTLYTSDFCGLKFWGPTSQETGPISGFDRGAIDQPIGRLFSEQDIEVFEIVFWPFAKLFGYTELSESKFKDKLSTLKSRLDRPFDFEKRLYKELDVDVGQLGELLPFKTMHRELKNAWQILEKEGTYLGMMKPLVLRSGDTKK